MSRDDYRSAVIRAARECLRLTANLATTSEEREAMERLADALEEHDLAAELSMDSALRGPSDPATTR